MNLFANIKFDAKDMARMLIAGSFMGTMWMDLKTDQIKTQGKVEFLQYQINELQGKKEKACIQVEPSFGILPKKLAFVKHGN